MSEPFKEDWKSHVKRMQSDAQNLQYILSKLWFKNEITSFDKVEVEQIINKIQESLKVI